MISHRFCNRRPRSNWLRPLLFLLAAAALSAFNLRAALPPLVIPAGAGVNIHFTSGHERDLDLIAAAGFKWVRMDFGWAGTERAKNQYDWSEYDALTAGLETRGLSAIYILDYSNPLYEETVASKNPITGEEQRDTASPQRPESVASFARWAAAAAAHFRGRPIIWEIWNEPNISFWKPKPDVQQYNTLALAVCKGVREADPTATIVGPATSEVPLEFLEGVFKSGLLDCFDAVTVHPYRNYNKPPETAADDYLKLRALIQRYASPDKKTIPIISGEWGYASHDKGVSLDTQAAYLVRQQLANLLSGIPISIWYDWKNDGPDPAEREHNFGTVTHDLSSKPAYTTAQTLTRQLAGYHIDSRLKTQSENDYVLLCKNASGAQKLAAWTLNPSNTVTLYLTPSLRPVSAVRGDGRPADVKWHNNGLTLDLGPLPQYITLRQ